MMKKMNAFSLPELLVAMSLGVLISLSLAELYINHEQSFKFQQATMQASHNGILASNLIKTIINSSGYMGCVSLSNLNVNNHFNDVPIEAIKVLNSNSDTKSWSHQPLGDSSLLQVSYLSPELATLLEPMKSKHYLHISNHIKVKAGDTLMVSDCVHADIFKVDEVYEKKDQQVIFTRSNLSQFHKNAVVGLWQQPILYLANTDRHDRYGKLIPALYWHTISGRDEELVEGVSGFQVKESSLNQLMKLTVQLTTLSSDVVSHLNNKSSVYPYHVMQHWQFNEYVPISFQSLKIKGR